MNKIIGTVIVTLILVALCAFVGYLAWGPNVEGDFEGMGYLGVILPILAVICAFMFGLGTGMSTQPNAQIEL